MSPAGSSAAGSRPAPDRTPDFVGVGVQKSGTSYAAAILAQHPQLVIQRKEINFFVRHFHRGYAWYENFFDAKQGRSAGELSPNYLYAPRPGRSVRQFYPSRNLRHRLLFWRRQASPRDELAERYPGLRVFAIFRNPVERAWSHYWYWRRRRERLGKPSVPFERIFADDGRWIRSQGLYDVHLAHWRERFPEFGVFFFDDLVEDPKALFRSLYAFLGVDSRFEPDFGGRAVNAGRKQAMPASLRALMRETYSGPIERFAAQTGRDLGAWLR